MAAVGDTRGRGRRARPLSTANASIREDNRAVGTTCRAARNADTADK